MADAPQAQASWHARSLGGQGGGDIQFLLLHGWGRTGESLVPLARQLAAHGHCWLPDLPGFGRTPMLAEGAGSAEYAAALLAQPVHAQARAAGRRIVVIGHSFGARVALRAAARDQAFADALVLIAGAGLRRRRSLPFRLRAAMLKAVGRLLKRCDRVLGTGLFARYAARVGSRDYREAGRLRATLVSVVNEDLSQVAAAVRRPTLLVYGAADRETPPEFGRRYAALMPDAELVILDGFGHLDILGPGAFQCAHRILDFLARKGLLHPAEGAGQGEGAG